MGATGRIGGEGRDAFLAGILQHRVFGTSGPFLRFCASNVALGRTVQMGELLGAPDGNVTIHASVSAPLWIPVEELRVIVNGEIVESVSLSTPPQSVTRYAGDLAIELSEDAWIIIEAGALLPEGKRHTTQSLCPYSLLLPKYKPFAFTNPILIDRDGDNEFDPPGL